MPAARKVRIHATPWTKGKIKSDSKPECKIITRDHKRIFDICVTLTSSPQHEKSNAFGICPTNLANASPQHSSQHFSRTLSTTLVSSSYLQHIATKNKPPKNCEVKECCTCHAKHNSRLRPQHNASGPSVTEVTIPLSIHCGWFRTVAEDFGHYDKISEQSSTRRPSTINGNPSLRIREKHYSIRFRWIGRTCDRCQSYSR